MNLDAGADGGGQPRIIVELLADQKAGGHLTGFAREGSRPGPDFWMPKRRVRPR
jgi:hypothetical protein